MSKTCHFHLSEFDNLGKNPPLFDIKDIFEISALLYPGPRNYILKASKSAGAKGDVTKFK